MSWGSEDGPNVIGASVTGSGDVIAANTLYEPFIGVLGPAEHKGEGICPCGYTGNDPKDTKNP
ncbi:MAG: hypothetical protein AAFQ07_05855, partial [Chloroflexota bacterium]